MGVLVFLTCVGLIPVPTILAPVKKASLLVRNRGQGSVHRSADSPWFLIGGLLAGHQKTKRSQEQICQRFWLDIGTLIYIVSLLLAATALKHTTSLMSFLAFFFPCLRCDHRSLARAASKPELLLASSPVGTSRCDASSVERRCRSGRHRA